MKIKNLSQLIVELYEKLSSWEEDVVKDSGLTTTQAHIIDIVGHSGSIKMKDLAEKTEVTTGTLTVAADRLEERNLLKRKPHESDRRSYLIELTPEGESYFKQHHKFHLRMTEDLVSDLTEKEQEIFAGIRETMYRMLSEKGNPNLSSLNKILNTLGLTLTIETKGNAA